MMTVKDLKDFIKDLPDDACVYVETPHGEDDADAHIIIDKL